MKKTAIAVADKLNKAVCVGDMVLVFYPSPRTFKTEVGKVSRLMANNAIKIKGNSVVFSKFYKLAEK